MCSELPKVLHPIAGKPLLAHVISTAKQHTSQLYVVYHQDQVKQQISQTSENEVEWIYQAELNGTGTALACAIPELKDTDDVLVLLGDVPLISDELLAAIEKKALINPNAVILVTGIVDNPLGLGRIVRDKTGDILRIVEEKDANSEEKAIQEIFSGIMRLPVKFAKTALPQLSCQNAQQEYYLTELVAIAIEQGLVVTSVQAETLESIQGVNTQTQLIALERAYQRQQALALLANGVRVMDPNRLDIRGEVIIAPGVILDVGVVLEGNVTIDSDTVVGPYTILRDTVLAKGVTVHAHSMIENSVVAEQCSIGPFAYLRANCVLGPAVQVGNFVELKNTQLGQGTKAKHLAYLGDAVIGEQVNIGAGVITCNYDGANKHVTTIEDQAFIGAGSQLVAPITVGKRATVGAGSVVAREAPADQLTVSRSAQRSITGWKRPTKTN